ncbi:MAG: DEAD/DEAH box helicase [Flavobacteriia bacterium]|nr:DEAD/DEAH box helicase [Flavobacteriia bacterium]
MAKIVLEKLVKDNPASLPEFFKNLDKETFGIDWKLHEYQQSALRHALNTLYYFFHQKEHLYNHYQTQTNEDWKKQISYANDSTHFGLLGQYYKVEENQIPYTEFLNRASLWMATGSGKTLVLIKLIEFLHQLATYNHIPKNDILILAPKPEILNQIKEHIEVFNKNSSVKIILKDLREFEKSKHLQTSLYEPDGITVFYYRSDNINDVDKTEQLSYKTVLNNGKWYVLLDEAHKGDKEDSIRQAYYSILAHKGFIFSFSASFTDTVDIVTTAYNFNLKKFIETGFGKHITVSGEEYKNWNKNKEDYSETEKTEMVVKSLLVLTAIKKEAEYIKTYHPDLYHNPLLITIANEVNTVDAELKLFFKQLAIVASGNYDIEKAKEVLSSDLIIHKAYQFNTAEIPSSFIQIIENISKEDILKYVFNASSYGKIEYTRILNNSREIAFRLKTADAGQHFCLLVASDATKWSDNVLDNYEYTETPLTKSYFKEINSQTSGINILLGSRIFTEGWDSNRPNVVNFINIGVDEGAQKFVLQAIGRGVRIQPVSGIRKRLDYIVSPEETETLSRYIDIKAKADILKRNLPLESLFLFATKKEVIKNITENLSREKDADDWKIVKHIAKTAIPQELLIPKYEEVIAEIPAYSINRDEYNDLLEFVGKSAGVQDKIVLMQSPINVSKTLVSTLEKIRIETNFNFTVSRSIRKPIDNLLLLNQHFNQKPKRLKSFEPVLTEINHFDKIEVANLPDNELELLEQAIIDSIKGSKSEYNSVSDIVAAYTAKKLNDQQLQEQLDLFNSKDKPNNYSYNGLKLELNTDFLVEHYYNPIILTSEAHKQLFKHIVWVPSEVEFLKKLQENRDKLEKYEWWYFSKIDQTTDDVSIPYYDTREQEYRNFFPDFVFWLKPKDSNKLIIKFIDPKGNVVGTGNAEDKAKGYENIFNGHTIKYNDKEVQIDLFFYNEPTGVNESVREYFTKDFKKMFE